MPVLPDLNPLTVFSIGTADLVKLKLFTGSEKREDHVPHMVFFEDTLFTHASFAHQCVFTSGTAGSRQGHPATWQAHSTAGNRRQWEDQGFKTEQTDQTVHIVAHPLTRG